MLINYNTYLDKVHGGWLGKCLGGAAGAPVEGIKKVLPYKNYKELFRADLPNDDLDLQLLWLEVLQKKGLDIKAQDLAEAWEKQCWYPFNEYGIFLKNYERGIMPPYSGAFNNPVFSEGEGCPIRSEIWGMIFPGAPEKAAQYASIDGSLDHAGAAVWIEQYYAAIEAQAFLENDIWKLIVGQLHYLPEGSKPRACVEDVLQEFEKGHKDWKKARTLLMRKYAHFDFTNAITNLGIVIIALLYGNENMDDILNIAFLSGFDTDCTCATAGAIRGIIEGAQAIDQELKDLVQDEFVVGIDLARDNNSILQLSKETCDIGIKADTEENKKADTGIKLEIHYLDKPAIGYEDCCKLELEVKNQSQMSVCEKIKIENLPQGWEAVFAEENIKILPGESKIIPFIIQTTTSIEQLHNTNILKITLGEKSLLFGISGAAEWKAVGPYFEALEKEDPAGLPSPHGGGCNLPTLECMVNNAAFIDKKYVDESNFKAAFCEDEPVLIHGYEDLLNLDEVFTFQGQGCIYLKQELISPEDREVWAVIGNNDGFKMWINQKECLEKDEMRLWTPYNNYSIVPLKKGKNEIVIKLLRRTETLKLSLAFRKYEGEHFHRKRWCVDFSCTI